MDKKEFKQITANEFTRYGFIQHNKKFFLILPNIVIRAQYLPYPWDKGLMIEWDLLIKKLSKFDCETGDCSVIEQAFDDFSEIPVQMPALQHLVVKEYEGDVNGVYVAEQWDKDKWSRELSLSLKNTFDGFKKNDLKECKRRSGIRPSAKRDFIILNDKVKKFLRSGKNFFL